MPNQENAFRCNLSCDYRYIAELLFISLVHATGGLIFKPLLVVSNLNPIAIKITFGPKKVATTFEDSPG